MGRKFLVGGGVVEVAVGAGGGSVRRRGVVVLAFLGAGSSEVLSVLRLGWWRGRRSDRYLAG